MYETWDDVVVDYLLQITNVIEEKILQHEVRFGIILSCYMYSLSKEWDENAKFNYLWSFNVFNTAHKLTRVQAPVNWKDPSQPQSVIFQGLIHTGLNLGI